MRIINFLKYLLPVVLLPVALAAQQPDSAPPLLGRVVAGRYVSPGETFRATLPPGGKTTARLADRAPAGRDFLFTYSDGYCRQVLVVETRAEVSPEELGAWVGRQVVATMDSRRVLGLERRRDSTRLGAVEWLEWTSPEGAPCEEVTVRNGQPGPRARPDAEAAMAVLLAPGRVYRVLYLAGRGGQGAISDGIRRLPAAQVLRELLEGFDPAP